MPTFLNKPYWLFQILCWGLTVVVSYFAQENPNVLYILSLLALVIVAIHNGLAPYTWYERRYWALQLLWWWFNVAYVLSRSYLVINPTPYRWLPYILGHFFTGLIVTHLYHLLNLRLVRRYGSAFTLITPFLGTTVLSLAMAVLHGALMAKELALFPTTNNYYNVLQFYIEAFRFSSPWFLGYHLYFYMQNNVEAAQANTLKKEAELERLKMQLNPHFLFNALNSIKALTTIDTAQAREGIVQLSDLLRKSLSWGDKNLIPLREEIEYVKDYLHLEQMRFGKRLICSFEIDPNSLNEDVPPMTLQILAENAIKHGVSTLPRTCLVVIFTKVSSNGTVLEVSNCGHYEPHEDRRGIGLNNLERRLEIAFEGRASLSIDYSAKEEIVKAKVVILK